MDPEPTYARLALDFRPYRLEQEGTLEFNTMELIVPADTRCILAQRIAEVAGGPLDGLRFDLIGSSWRRDS